MRSRKMIFVIIGTFYCLVGCTGGNDKAGVSNVNPPANPTNNIDNLTMGECISESGETDSLYKNPTQQTFDYLHGYNPAESTQIITRISYGAILKGEGGLHADPLIVSDDTLNKNFGDTCAVLRINRTYGNSSELNDDSLLLTNCTTTYKAGVLQFNSHYAIYKDDNKTKVKQGEFHFSCVKLNFIDGTLFKKPNNSI